MVRLKRDKMCGDVDRSDVGRELTLMGWVNRRRDLGKLIFVDLRDRSGIIQIVFDENVSSEAFNKASELRSEFVIVVRGEVVLRDQNTVNPKLKTGELEVKAKELIILNRSEVPPFQIEDDLNISEVLRLKYRYLDLRRPSMQRNLIIRHRAASIVRNFLNQEGFIEVETPMLTKSTPEGARDYIVPSRLHPGKFYALPQSPQLFKQLLMLAGMDRYYQIVRCFRDEDLRADRQPEFTQIDIEMSFVDMEDVLEINERMIAKLFGELLGLEVKLPLLRMPYKEAMEKYGSDKPDLRFGLELVDLTDILKNSEVRVFSDTINNGGIVKGLNAKGGACFPRREIDGIVDYAKGIGAKGLIWMAVTSEGIKSPIIKFLKEEETDEILKRMQANIGDLILIVADSYDLAHNILGQLRIEMAKKLNLINKNEYKFLWVVDFPLLEFDTEENRYIAKHHPFTSPKDEDIPLLDSDPLKVRAKAYDMVLNGIEIGGGSIRIYDTSLQEKMFAVLGFTKEEAWEKFGFLMEAFKYGAPPHGGIAYGFDRIVMFLADTDNIRDVIAFPKTQSAYCHLTEAPSYVTEKQLKEVHIRIED